MRTLDHIKDGVPGKLMGTGEGHTTWGLLESPYRARPLRDDETSAFPEIYEEGELNSNRCNVSSPDDSVAADPPSSPELA